MQAQRHSGDGRLAAKGQTYPCHETCLPTSKRIAVHAATMANRNRSSSLISSWAPQGWRWQGRVPPRSYATTDRLRGRLLVSASLFSVRWFISSRRVGSAGFGVRLSRMPSMRSVMRRSTSWRVCRGRGGDRVFAGCQGVGPGPEEIFLFQFGAGFFEDETFVFEGEALGGKVAATECGEIVVRGWRAWRVRLRVVVGSGEGTGEGGVTDLEEADEFGAHLLEDGGVKVVGRVSLVKAESGLMELPAAEALLFPVRQVLGADGLASEFGGKESLYLREGVEPLEEALVWLAIIERC